MILRQQNPSRKPEPSVPMPARMLRPSALQLSKKLRPLVPAIWEAKALCSTAIRDAEIQGASQGDSLQLRHAKTVQHLEEQVIQEDGKSQIDFLSACQAAIQDSPVELQGMLVASYHVLMGQTPTSQPFTLSQGASPTEQPSAPVAPSPVPEHLPRPKQQHPF